MWKPSTIAAAWATGTYRWFIYHSVYQKMRNVTHYLCINSGILSLVKVSMGLQPSQV